MQVAQVCKSTSFFTHDTVNLEIIEYKSDVPDTFFAPNNTMLRCGRCPGMLTRTHLLHLLRRLLRRGRLWLSHLKQIRGSKPNTQSNAFTKTSTLV